MSQWRSIPRFVVLVLAVEAEQAKYQDQDIRRKVSKASVVHDFSCVKEKVMFMIQDQAFQPHVGVTNVSLLCANAIHVELVLLPACPCSLQSLLKQLLLDAS